MNAETIRSALSQSPFRPFTIRTMDGGATPVDRPGSLTWPAGDVVRVDRGDGEHATITLDAIVSLSFPSPL